MTALATISTPAKTRIRNFFGHRPVLRASSSHNIAEYKQVATRPLRTMHGTPRCGDNVIADLDASGVLVWSYCTPLLDQNVSTTSYGAETVTSYYNQDERQSVMNLTDDTGSVVNDYAYSAYGDKVDSLTGGSVEQRYTFTGRELSDTTGDFYFRYRWYGADVGGFMSRDPLGYTDGMSVYNGYFAAWVGIDPYGENSNPGCSILKQKMFKIKKYLDAGLEDSAADAVEDLVDWLITGGKLLEPLAAKNMEQWYKGTKKPLTYDADTVWGAITDTSSRAADVASPKDMLLESLCLTLGNPNLDLSKPLKKTYGVRATKGEYYHALGGFQVTFEGTATQGKDSCCWTLDGKWSIDDEYNWHKDMPAASVCGIRIPDSYFLLLEEHKSANPFKINGSAKKKLSFCCDDVEARRKLREGREDGGGEEGGGR